MHLQSVSGDGGEITVLGQKMGDGKRVPKGVGAIIETPGFLPNCSSYQNLRYLMELSGKSRQRENPGAISQVGLDPTVKKSTWANIPWACCQRLTGSGYHGGSRASDSG